jgi:hypothetical protein
MAHETAGTIVVGRAYVKHRLSYTDNIASDDSREFADFRSLCEREHRPVSQLPHDHGRDDFNLCVLMLRDSIWVLRALSYESDTILCRCAFNRNGWR